MMQPCTWRAVCATVRSGRGEREQLIYGNMQAGREWALRQAGIDAYFHGWRQTHGCGCRWWWGNCAQARIPGPTHTHIHPLAKPTVVGHSKFNFLYGWCSQSQHALGDKTKTETTIMLIFPPTGNFQFTQHVCLRSVGEGSHKHRANIYTPHCAASSSLVRFEAIAVR